MLIENAKTIVIKIGSSLSIEKDNFSIRKKWLESLISDVADLQKRGKKIIIVTSGSIALGRKSFLSKKHNNNLKLQEKQAAAAIGQIELAVQYRNLLSEFNIEAAQILLTIFDLDNRSNSINVSNTINTLVNNSIVPIINENDSVATDEILFGDNDRLSARVAQTIHADLLILLSDIDGLYTSNPKITKNAKLIDKVKEITPEIMAMASKTLDNNSSGGMITKIEAAKIANLSGINMIIADGKINNPLKNYEKEKRGTIFFASKSKLNSKKSWIANTTAIKGKIIIDEGASNALKKGKSLLAVGIRNILGTFKKGDTISIHNSNDDEIGKGLTTYSSNDILRIKGYKKESIKNILGPTGKEEVINCDDIILY